MSTRATYKIGKTCFYIHHDGYPEGAAKCFLAALLCDNQRGGLETAFIRANDTAVITTSHEGHGDTEYQYTVSKGLLSVDAVVHDWNSGASHNKGIFVGSVADFVHAYSGVKLYLHGGTHYTLNSLVMAAVMAAKEAVDYTDKFGPGGNSSSSADRAYKFLEILQSDLSLLSPEQVAAINECLLAIAKLDLKNVCAFGWAEQNKTTTVAALQQWRASFRKQWSALLSAKELAI
jgi:hypothetical protein